MVNADFFLFGLLTSLVGVVLLVFVLLIGFAMGANSVVNDCAKYGSYQHNDTTLSCELQATQ
jgi:uncharacterized membrane protein YphA (DoxX/SURF4 family)